MIEGRIEIGETLLNAKGDPFCVLDKIYHLDNPEGFFYIIIAQQSDGTFVRNLVSDESLRQSCSRIKAAPGGHYED